MGRIQRPQQHHWHRTWRHARRQAQRHRPKYRNARSLSWWTNCGCLWAGFRPQRIQLEGLPLFDVVSKWAEYSVNGLRRRNHQRTTATVRAANGTCNEGLPTTSTPNTLTFCGVHLRVAHERQWLRPTPQGIRLQAWVSRRLCTSHGGHFTALQSN